MIPFPHPRLRPAARLAAGLVLLGTVQRAVLWACFGPRGAGAAGLAGVFAIGLRADLATAGWAALIPVLWLSLIPDRWAAARWHRRFMFVVGSLAATVAVFGAVAEYFFFEEFDARFNVLAVDYLLYPAEILGDLRAEYPFFPLVALCVGLGILLAWLARDTRPAPGIPVRVRLADLAAIGPALVLAIAAAPGAPPRWSADRVLDELSGSGLYGFVQALVTRDLRWADHYRTLPPAEAWTRARRQLASPSATFTGGQQSIERAITGDPARPRLNVVVVLAESLGCEFWGAFGRTPSLTPRLDVLAREGLLFTRIYACGERTVRGMEGALASFPPLPGESLIRRSSPGPVASLARTLRADGYATELVYGGRGTFDGMRTWALAAGYDRFVEERDYAHPSFVNVWGVADEDLFAKALEAMRALHAAGRPFFSTIITVSNHKPYTYPPDRIRENPQDRNRGNAVKYSDWALGEFFDRAKREPFWANTVFVVVADHGARVYGSPRLPVRSHEIPILVLGPAAVRGAPRRIGTLGSTLDVVPTALGLVGRPYRSVFFGRDLLRDPAAGARALLNHNRDSGILRDRSLAILGIGRTASFWRYDPAGRGVTPVGTPGPADSEVARDAAALFQVADEMVLKGTWCPAGR